MDRSRWMVALLLFFTLTTGVLGGMVAERTWFSPSPHAKEEHDDDGDQDERKAVIERFADELELTPDQRSRIDTILTHFRARMESLRRQVKPRYESLVDSARSEIEAVLEPDQVERYRELLRRRHGDEDDDAEKGRD